MVLAKKPGLTKKKITYSLISGLKKIEYTIQMLQPENVNHTLILTRIRELSLDITSRLAHGFQVFKINLNHLMNQIQLPGLDSTCHKRLLFLFFHPLCYLPSRPLSTTLLAILIKRLTQAEMQARNE